LQDYITQFGYFAVFVGTFLEGETVLALGGLAAAYELRDWDLCAAILDRWVLEKFLVGPHRDLGARVGLALPESYLRTYRGLAHRAEMYSLVPMGSVPVRIPRSPQAIHEAFQRDGGVEVLRATFLAMAGRRYWGLMAEARAVAVAAEPQANLVLLRTAPAAPIMAPLSVHSAGGGMISVVSALAAISCSAPRIAWLAATPPAATSARGAPNCSRNSFKPTLNRSAVDSSTAA